MADLGPFAGIGGGSGGSDSSSSSDADLGPFASIKIEQRGNIAEAGRALARGVVGGAGQAASGVSALLPESAPDLGVGRAGKAVTGYARERFAPSPGREGEFFANELPEAVGGMAPGAAAVIGGSVAGTPLTGLGVGAALFGAQGAGSAAEEAEAKGASAGQRQAAAAGGALSGAALSLIPGGTLTRLMRLPGTALPGILGYGMRTAAAGGEGASIGAIGRGIDNAIAQYTYDPDRTLSEGMAHAATLTGASAGLLHSLVGELGRRRPEAPTPEPEAPQPGQLALPPPAIPMGDGATRAAEPPPAAPLALPRPRPPNVADRAFIEGQHAAAGGVLGPNTGASPNQFIIPDRPGRPNLTEGDSIGVGFNKYGGLSGNPVGGRNPQAVLDNIAGNLQSDPGYYRGRTVLLSSGTMNDPRGRMTDLIPQQIRAIQEAGGNVILAGADTGKFADRNPQLESIASEAGVHFAGPLPTDKIHPGPQGYRDYVAGLGEPQTVGPQQAPLVPGGDRPIPGRFQQAVDYFVGKGLTNEQAIGITARLHAESGLDPNITNSIGATGIAQWLHSRRTGMEGFGAKGDFDKQLDYIWHEFNGSESKAFAEIRNASSAADAARAMERFERAREPAFTEKAARLADHVARTGNFPASRNSRGMSARDIEGGGGGMLALPAPEDRLALPKPDTTYGTDFLMSDTKKPAEEPKPVTAQSSPLDRALNAVSQLNPGDPVTRRLLAQLSGLRSADQIATLRDRMVKQGVVSSRDGRYYRAETANKPEVFSRPAPTPAETQQQIAALSGQQEPAPPGIPSRPPEIPHVAPDIIPGPAVEARAPQPPAPESPSTNPVPFQERPAPPAPAPDFLRPVRPDQMAITATGRAMPVDYGIASANDLVASHGTDLTPNPAFPQALQPRDRSRVATEMQIHDLINPNRFRPELLGETPDASAGAPIVGPDRVVESGNARTIALQRAYAENHPSAEAYRSFLQSQGYPIEGVDNPMLVRLNKTEWQNPADREAAAREMNAPMLAAMSSTERALADSRALPMSVLDLHREGDLGSARNRQFLRRTLETVSTPGELGALIDQHGEISSEGLRRVRGAMIGKAYGDPDLVSRLVEDSDSNIKAIGNALTDAAPAWAKMRAEVEGGRVPAELDITPHLVEAVNLIGHARAQGRDIMEFMRQRGLFGEHSPETESILKWMLGPNFTRRVGQAKITEAARWYAEEAMKAQPGPDLLGEVPQTRVGPMIERARVRAQDDATGNIFGAQMEQRPSADALRESVAARGAADGRPDTGEAGARASEGGAERAGLRDELYSLVRERAPTLRLRTLDELVGTIEGRASPIHGAYHTETRPGGLLEHIASVALGGPDPRAALSHEIVHFFRRSGMFTRPEWEILSGKADKWAEQFKISERYKDQPIGVRREEAVAEAYAAWDRGDMQMPPGLRRIFGKVKDFFDRTGNWLRGRGFQNADDVFRSMDRGEVGARGGEDTVRLYRVNGGDPKSPVPDWIMQGQRESGHADASGRWFTHDPEAVKWYLQDAGEGARVSHIDIPKAEAEKYRVSNLGRDLRYGDGRPVRSYSRDPDNEFFLPRDLADKKQPVPPEAMHARPAAANDRVEAALRQIRTTPDDRPLQERSLGFIKSALNRIRDEARYAAVDSFDPIAKLEKGANKGELRDAAVSAFKAAHLSRELPAMMSQVVGLPDGKGGFIGGVPMLKDGAYVTNPDSKPLSAVLKPIFDAGLQKPFELWMAVTRGKRLMAEGRENLISPEMIAEFKDLDQKHLGPNGENIFRETQKEWIAFNKRLLDFAEQTGLVNKEQRGLWERGDYVPFFRNMGEEVPIGPGRGASGIANQNSGIKALKGGAEKLNSLYENMFTLSESLVSRSVKNEAARRTRDLAEPLAAMEKVSLSEKMAETGKRRGDNIVSLMDGGKQQYYRVTQPLLLKAISDFGPLQAEGITKWLGLPKKLLTMAVTREPTFMAGNLMRDTLHSWVVTGSDFKPGFDTMKGAIAAVRHSPEAMALMAGGGGGHHFYESGAKGAKGFIRELGGGWSALDPRRLWDKLGELGSASEMANRIAIYEAALKRGDSNAEAIWQAKDLLNFTASGGSQLMKFLVQTVPFMNARIQGLDRLQRGARENPASFLMRGGLITAASLGLWAMNKDNPDYQRLPDYEKQAYWHLFLPGFSLRIPKPFEVGAIFGAVPEMLGDFADNGNWNQLWRAFVANGTQQLNLSPIPQAFSPALDVATNTNSLTKGPIVNEAEKHLVPGERFGPNTSTTMKTLGQQIGVSPDQLEYLFKGYSGTLGGYLLSATDQLTDAATGRARPETRLDQYPIVSRFIRTEPTLANRWINGFYDIKTEADQLHATMGEMVKQGRAAEAQELVKDNLDMLGLRGSTQSIGAQLTAVRKAMKQIQDTPNLSEAEMRERLDQLTVIRNRLGESARQIVERARP